MTEDNESARHSLLYQIAVTIFLGIPMTIALGLALVFYCAYEYLKFHFTGERQAHSTRVVRRH